MTTLFALQFFRAILLNLATGKPSATRYALEPEKGLSPQLSTWLLHSVATAAIKHVVSAWARPQKLGNDCLISFRSRSIPMLATFQRERTSLRNNPKAPAETQRVEPCILETWLFPHPPLALVGPMPRGSSV